MEWNMDPELFGFGVLHIRYYGLLFALGFLLGYRFVTNIYTIEGKNVEDLDALLYALIGGTIVGARLGHCLFYEPATYLSDPIRIFKVWEGGLASHGGVIGCFIAVFIYSRYKQDQPFWWIADRLAFPIALTGCFIRIGNFFNSEIVGKPTELPWGVWFQRLDAEAIYRHPSMLYESFSYFCVFLITRHLYYKYKTETPRCLLIGLQLTLIFTARFLIEFTKENQVAFENQLPLNMGQMLSVPVVIIGIYLIQYSMQWKREREASAAA